MLVLLNAPVDTRSRAARAASWTLRTAALRGEAAGWLAGAAAYPFEVGLARVLREGPEYGAHGLPPARVSPRLSVIVVTYDSAAAVARCMPRVVEQLAPGDELIVVDNASRDGTLEPCAPPRPAPASSRRPATSASPPAQTPARPPRRDLLLFLDPDAEPRRVRRGDPPPPRRTPRLGSVDGPGHDGRRHAHQHERRRHPLHRDRLVRRGAASGHGGAARGPRRCRFSRGPASRCRVRPGSVWAASRQRSSCTARTWTCRCARGWPVDAWASSPPRGWTTTTTSPRCGELAAPGAKPLGGAAARLPGLAARGARAGAAGHGDRAARDRGRRRWLPAKLLAVVDTLRGLPRLLRERRAVRPTRTIGAAEFAPLAHARPRLRLPRPRGHPRPAALGVARLLAARHRGAERGRIGMRSNEASGCRAGSVWIEPRSVGMQEQAQCRDAEQAQRRDAEQAQCRDGAAQRQVHSAAGSGG